MGATISGKGRVFKREHDGWSSYQLGISSKDKDGNWLNAYQPIRFRKDVEVANGTEIEFKAFPVVKERSVEGQNRNYIVWMILEFKSDDGFTPEEAAALNFTPMQDGDIPF